MMLNGEESVLAYLLNRQISQLAPCSNAALQRRTLCASPFLMGKLSKFRVFGGHSGCVNTVMFSEDGEVAITGSDDTYVNFHSIESGKMIKSFETAHTRNIFFAKDLEFSCGNRLLTCAADGCVLITDVNRHNSFDLVHKHRGRAHRIALIPNSPDCFLSTGEDGLCCVFDVRLSKAKNGQMVGKTTFRDDNKSPRSIFSVCVNPCHPSSVCLGGEFALAQQYDLRNFVSPNTFYAPKHMSSEDFVHLTGVRYNAQGNEILLSYSGEKIYALDVDKHGRNTASTDDGMGTAGAAHGMGTAGAARGPSSSSSSSGSLVDPVPPDTSEAVEGQLMSFSGHINEDTVKSVAWLGTRSEFVCTGSDCGHVFIWSRASGQLVKLLKADSRGAVNCLTPHPTLPMLATSGLSHDAKLWAPVGEYVPYKRDGIEENEEVRVHVSPSPREDSRQWAVTDDSEGEVSENEVEAYCEQQARMAAAVINRNQRIQSRHQSVRSIAPSSDVGGRAHVLRSYYRTVPRALLELFFGSHVASVIDSDSEEEEEEEEEDRGEDSSSSSSSSISNSTSSSSSSSNSGSSSSSSSSSTAGATLGNERELQRAHLIQLVRDTVGANAGTGVDSDSPSHPVLLMDVSSNTGTGTGTGPGIESASSAVPCGTTLNSRNSLKRQRSENNTPTASGVRSGDSSRARISGNVESDGDTGTEGSDEEKAEDGANQESDEESSDEESDEELPDFALLSHTQQMLVMIQMSRDLGIDLRSRMRRRDESESGSEESSDASDDDDDNDSSSS